MIEPTSVTALFAGSFLASTLLPGGSEAMLLYAVNQEPKATFEFWLVATVGNTLGGLSSWLIGWWIASRFPERGLHKPEHARALYRVNLYGSPLLLFSWLPLVGDPLCLAAGWTGIRFVSATIFIAIGKGLRYAAILGFFSYFFAN